MQNVVLVFIANLAGSVFTYMLCGKDNKTIGIGFLKKESKTMTIFVQPMLKSVHIR